MTGLGWSYRLFSIDLRSLALFRVGLGAILLTDILFLRFPDLGAYYADGGMFTIEHARTWHADSGRWSLCLINGLEEYQAGILAVAACCSFLLMVGWRTGWMTVACWILAVSIGNRNPLVCNYGDTILRIFLFWSMFLPLGARWSLDSRLRRGSHNQRSSPAEYSVASAAVLLQLSFIYFFAAIWKWNDDWLQGTAAATALQLEYARRETMLDQSIPLSLLQPLSVATLWLELLGPLIVWIPWRTQVFRYSAIIAFLTLHLSIELLFTPVLLSYICALAWVLFLPSSFWESAWMRRILRKPTDAIPAKETIESTPPSNLALFRKRVMNTICLAFLCFVFLWNLASLPSEKLSFLMPQPLRWVGNVTLMGQKWNIFYRPSKHNGWHKAKASLKDGSLVDVLRGGEPFEVDLLESNWSYFDSIRGKLFFRRLGTMKSLAPLEDPVANYLRTRWSEDHAENQRATRLTLLYYERLDASAGGGFTAREAGTSTAETGPDWDAIFNPMEALMSGNAPLSKGQD